MKIPKDIAERVVTGPLQELWETFIALRGEYPKFEEDYEMVRFGINSKFEIHDLWEDTNKIIRKDKIGCVYVEKDIIKITDFRTEKEERRRIMVNAILENINDEDIISAR